MNFLPSRLCRRWRILIAAAFLYAPAVSAFTPDFGKSHLKKDDKQGSCWVFGPKKEFVAGVSVYPKSEFPNFKLALENDALVIDTRGIYKSGVAGRSITLRFYQADLKNAYKAPANQKNHTKTNRVTMEVKSEAPAEMILYFEGEQMVKGKKTHYWRSKNIMLNGKWQNVTFDQVFPDNLTKLWIRADLRKPAKIAIRRVVLEQVPLNGKPLDPAQGKK